MFDARYGAGRSLFDCSAAEADAILANARVADQISDDRAYYGGVRVYQEGEYDALRPSWHKVVYGGQGAKYQSDRRAEGGKPLPAPTVEQLRRHRDKFMPATTHLRANHRLAVQEVAELYGLDLSEQISKDALIRSVARKGKVRSV